MTGLIAYLLVRFRQYRAGALSEEVFETLLGRLHLARLHGLDKLGSERAAQVQALPVSKLVGAVDDIFDLPAYRGAFLDWWRFLSEFCHPNTFARFITGQRLVEGSLHFDREPGLTPLEVRTAIRGDGSGSLGFVGSSVMVTSSG